MCILCVAKDLAEASVAIPVSRMVELVEPLASVMDREIAKAEEFAKRGNNLLDVISDESVRSKDVQDWIAHETQRINRRGWVVNRFLEFVLGWGPQHYARKIFQKFEREQGGALRDKLIADAVAAGKTNPEDAQSLIVASNELPRRFAEAKAVFAQKLPELKRIAAIAPRTPYYVDVHALSYMLDEEANRLAAKVKQANAPSTSQ